VGDFRDLLQTWLAGWITGLVVCLPIGPVNLTVINTTLRKGFLRGFLVGAGAVTADLVYISLALAGHASLPRDPRLLIAIQIAAVIVVTVLGLRNLFQKTKKFEVRSEAVAERVDERWHHPRSFLLGFLLAISNLGLLLLWATVTAGLAARELVNTDQPASRWFCGVGIGAGAASWFSLIAWVVSHAHRRITPEALAWAARICGIVFLLFAVALVYNLIARRF
jgi:threonine/homoserine/homoserine lactone efflux protein